MSGFLTRTQIFVKDTSLMSEEELKYASNYSTHLDFLIINKVSKQDVYKRQVMKSGHDDGYLTVRGKNTVLNLNGSNAAMENVSDLMLEDGLEIVAVSYTHLDVYKRQAIHRAAYGVS